MQVITKKFINKDTKQSELHRFTDMNTLRKFVASMTLPWGPYQRVTIEHDAYKKWLLEC